MTRRRPTAAAVVFALLVLATVAAFAYAQQKKRDPLIIDRVSLSGGAIEFRTTTSNDATVQVVRQPGGEVVRTLARGRFLKRYTCHVLGWDGSVNGGGAASPGRYRVRVQLEDEDRTLVLPGTIHLPPPEPKLAPGAPTRRFFKPAGDGCKGKSS